jgi:transcriptional regulator with XRE-family HTH domain
VLTLLGVERGYMHSVMQNTDSAVNEPSFGAFVQHRREELHLSLREFAKRVGVAGSYVSGIETSAMPPPSAEIISHMAQVLAVRESELFARAGQLNASTWRWFWSQPAVQNTLACASGMNERFVHLYVHALFPDIAAEATDQHDRPRQNDVRTETRCSPRSYILCWGCPNEMRGKQCP